MKVWEVGGCKRGERSGRIGGRSPGHTKTWMQAEKPTLPSGPLGDLKGWGGYGTTCLSEGSPGCLPRRQDWGDRGGRRVFMWIRGWEAGISVSQPGALGPVEPPCSLQRLELPRNTSGHRPSLAVAETERQRPPINREIQVSKQPSGSLATGAEVGQCPQWAAGRAARHASLPSSALTGKATDPHSLGVSLSGCSTPHRRDVHPCFTPR